MDLFRVRVRIFNLQHVDRFQDLDMVVDTGATYSVIPAKIAERLELRATHERTFTLADGRKSARRLGQAGFAYNGTESPSLVVLGEAEHVALLGAHALEGLGLEVDPVAGKLRPTTLYLL